VNTIGLPDVPTADSDPLIVSVRVDEFPSTRTPDSIVNVTPEETITFPVITYGLFAAVHAVFDEIVPDTFVAKAADGSKAPTATTTNTTSARDQRRVARILACCNETNLPPQLIGLHGRQDTPPDDTNH